MTDEQKTYNDFTEMIKDIAVFQEKNFPGYSPYSYVVNMVKERKELKKALQLSVSIESITEEIADVAILAIALGVTLTDKEQFLHVWEFLNFKGTYGSDVIYHIPVDRIFNAIDQCISKLQEVTFENDTTNILVQTVVHDIFRLCKLLMYKYVSFPTHGLYTVVYEKMQINWTRKWGPSDFNGVIEHVREGKIDLTQQKSVVVAVQASCPYCQGVNTHHEGCAIGRFYKGKKG